MKKLSLIVISAALITSCNSKEEATTTEVTPVVMSQEAMIKRGEYLVAVGDCNACHSPKKMGPNGPVVDKDLLLSGYPADRPYPKIDPAILQSWVLFGMDQTMTVGPWGISFAANLTSDDTGIGSWTEAQFIKAIKDGKYKGLDGSRMLLPPMPWEAFREMPTDDLKAIYAYLKSTKPVKNIVPAAVAIQDIEKI